jgi:4-amino-4-deoxy-L-arabinose transferase-like glycosyltransferase
MAPFAALAAPCVWRRRREPEIAFLLAWLVPAWLLFEAVPTKLPHYVLPLYPAVALAIALVIEQREMALDRRWARAVLLLVPLVALLFIAAALGLGLWQKIMPGWAAWLAAPLILWQAWRSSRPAQAKDAARGVMGAIALAWLVYFGVYEGLLTSSFANPVSLSPRLAQALNSAKAATSCPNLATATTSYREPSLVFLVGTGLHLTDPAGAAAFLAQAPCRAALVEAHEQAAFLKALPPQTGARLFEQVRGFNFNRGRWLDIGVWIRPGAGR